MSDLNHYSFVAFLLFALHFLILFWSFLVICTVTSLVSAMSFGSESSDWSEMGGSVHITKGCGTDNTGLNKYR